MRRPVPATDGNRSATIVPTLLLTLGCSAFAALMAYGADPSWWNSRGAVHTEQVVTNNGVVTTNYVPNNYAVVTQGQLKQFTARAVDELNADLTNNGGAGSALSNVVYGWQQDYATNGYATNTANPARPYKPSDYTAINVGQLKYIAGLVYGQLANAGYTGLYPSWIQQNSATDNTVANLGQLKEVFDFDLTASPNAVQDLTATAGVDAINLSWTLPPVNNATSLTVQESTDGGMTWTNVATLDAASTFYAVADSDSTTFANAATPRATSKFYSLADSDSTTGLIFQVVSTNANASSGNNSTATSSPSAPTSPLPPQQYAVIDLGTNVAPLKVTDSSYVLERSQSPTDTNPQDRIQYGYSVWSGLNSSNPTVLQPLNSANLHPNGTTTFLGYVATDIGEDGTVVGLETAYSADTWITPGTYPSANGNIPNLAVWSPGAAQPALTAPYVAVSTSPYSNSTHYLSSSLYWDGLSGEQSGLGNTGLNHNSYPYLSSSHIWSTQVTYDQVSPVLLLIDGFSASKSAPATQTELGTIAGGVANTNILTGYDIFPLAANNSDQSLMEKDSGYTNMPSAGSPSYPEWLQPSVTYLLGTNVATAANLPVGFTPQGGRGTLSNVNALGHSNVLGSNSTLNTTTVFYSYSTSPYFYNSPTQYLLWDGTVQIVLPQSPGSTSPVIYPVGVNGLTQVTTTGSTTQTNAATQVIGTDGTNGYVWQLKPPSTNAPSFAYPQKLDLLVAGYTTNNTPPWSQAIPSSINDSGAIVGTATYSGTNTAIAQGSHGVLLLPCQYSLLNGNQSGTDGLNFDGTRPTTISATATDNTTTVADIGNTPANGGGGNDGLDILGNDVPFGQGRPDNPGNAYAYSLMVVAKVSPATATSISYSWNRVFEDRGVTIIKTLNTSTNTYYWEVKSVNSANNPTGFPTPYPDTDGGSHQTTTPSAKSILYSYDDPAMNFAFFNACGVGDYAYEECNYTYTLTITMGSATATRVINVGNVITAQRAGTGIGASNWTGKGNVVSTTSIPDCQMPNDSTHVAIIRSIVGGSLPIVIDSHANDPNPNP
jgi:hypothetical protein